jgi:hypothetical protein
MELGGHVACMGERRNVYRLLVGELERKRPLGRTIHKWMDNINVDLVERGCTGLDWIVLAQDWCKWRVSREHSDDPLGSIHPWETIECYMIGGLLSSAQPHRVSRPASQLVKLINVSIPVSFLGVIVVQS